MSALILHSGAKQVDLDQVRAVPTPTPTASWAPVGYGRILDHVHTCLRAIQAPVLSESYGLGRGGNQLFGVLRLDSGEADRGISIGIRQSLDMSLSLGLAVGLRVFVCDNLAFSGSSLWVVRKNTKRVWPAFIRLLDGALNTMLDAYRRIAAQLDAYKQLECSQDRGYEILGRMVGREVITPTQAGVAYGDWRHTRHPEFGERTLYSLYNCVTQGLKSGAPGAQLGRHVGAHAFFQTIVDPSSMVIEA